MATLLHDAVMNPAEGNVPWSQGGARRGCVEGQEERSVDGRAEVGEGLLVPRQSQQEA